MRVTLATTEGLTITTKIVSDLHLVLTNNSNEHHTYSIPGCVYNPESPLNILVIPVLGEYFDDGADIQCPLEEEGTTIKSGSNKSNFVWDHRKHERHFIHGSRYLTEIILYFGHGYFNAF